MKKQQLIANAQAKGFKVEFSKDFLGSEMIGINKGKSCYHWFKSFDDACVFFDHTYSCNTGNINRGISHAIKVQDSLGFYI